MTSAGRAIAVGALSIALAGALLPSCSCRDDQAPRINTVQERAWACEACGHTFTAPQAKGVQECPKCGKQAAVRSATYKCGKCGKYFEAYRFLDTTGLDSPKGPDGKPIAPGFYFKRKGGRWVEDEEMLGETTCPHCGNSDPARLQLTAPPPSGS